MVSRVSEPARHADFVQIALTVLLTEVREPAMWAEASVSSKMILEIPSFSETDHCGIRPGSFGERRFDNASSRSDAIQVTDGRRQAVDVQEYF